MKSLNMAGLSIYFYIILSFLIAVVATTVIIPLIVAFCRKYGYYDQPDQRKIHHAAIPRLGGLAFLPAMSIAAVTVMVLYYSKTTIQPVFHASTALMMIGASMIYALGIFDDLLDLKAKLKFFILMVASAFVPLCNLYISNLEGIFGIYEISLWISYPLTVLVIMTIVNAINLIDGIDGLASGISIIILLILTFLFVNLRSVLFSVISAGLLGSLLSFFCYNFFGHVGRHKIFMGDAGSLILGYVMSYLAIKYMMLSNQDIYTDNNPLLIPFSLFIVPVFDLIRVAFTRLLNGEPMFKADKRHIHHLLMAMGLTMHQTLCCILAMVLFFLFVNYALDYLGAPFTVIILLDLALFALFFVLTYSISQYRAFHTVNPETEQNEDFCSRNELRGAQ